MNPGDNDPHEEQTEPQRKVADRPAIRIGADPFEPEYDIAELDVCLTCFKLRGMYDGREHRCGCQPRDDEWRKQHWPNYDIAASLDLCGLCRRRPMRTGSRWSWYACDRCRNVNIRVGEAIAGPRASVLPFGRHSLMNGVSLSSSDVDNDASTAAFAKAMRELSGFWSRLPSWSTEEAERLVESGSLQGDSVPLQEWIRLFPSSLGASADAFCRFLHTDLPSVPHLERLSETLHAYRNGDAGYEETLLDMTIDRIDVEPTSHDPNAAPSSTQEGL